MAVVNWKAGVFRPCFAHLKSTNDRLCRERVVVIGREVAMGQQGPRGCRTIRSFCPDVCTAAPKRAFFHSVFIQDKGHRTARPSPGRSGVDIVPKKKKRITQPWRFHLQKKNRYLVPDMQFLRSAPSGFIKPMPENTNCPYLQGSQGKHKGNLLQFLSQVRLKQQHLTPQVRASLKRPHSSGSQTR